MRLLQGQQSILHRDNKRTAFCHPLKIINTNLKRGANTNLRAGVASLLSQVEDKIIRIGSESGTPLKRVRVGEEREAEIFTRGIESYDCEVGDVVCEQSWIKRCSDDGG